MRLKILIVDDEPLAREHLGLLLGRDPDIEAVFEARNGSEAVSMLKAEKLDLVFLDIQMPRMDGLAVVEAVGAENMPAVIFVTAHDQYAVRAFEISAVDYLLKPVTEGRFRRAFERAKNRINVAVPGEDSTRQMLAMLDTIANPRRHLARVAVRAGERTIFIAVEDVDRIEAAQNYVRLHCGAVSHMVHVPMNTMETSLDPASFVRIHRSHIVNVKRIKQVWTLAHGQYVVEMNSGERLPTGRTYGDRVRALVANPF